MSSLKHQQRPRFPPTPVKPSLAYRASESKMGSSLTLIQQAPIAFFDLPGGVRNRIYYYALGSSSIHAIKSWPLRYRGPYRPRFNSEWPSIGLLLSCKRIHNEAAFILYQYVHLHIYMVPSKYPLSPASVNDVIGKRYERHCDLIKNLQIEVDWSEHTRADFFNHPDASIPQPSDIQALCDAIADLRHLKVTRIRWACFQGWPGSHRHKRPEDVHCRELLQPFVRLRAKGSRLEDLRLRPDRGRT